MHIQISLGTKFHLKLTRLNFWVKLIQKGYFRTQKKKKLKITLHKQCCIFRPNLLNKDIYGQKQIKWTSSLNSTYQISLGTKFQLKLTILIFLTRFAQNGFFWSNREKASTTYFLHNSAYSNKSGAKFQLKLTVLIFWTKFAQKSISSQKLTKWTSSLNSTYSTDDHGKNIWGKL